MVVYSHAVGVVFLVFFGFRVIEVVPFVSVYPFCAY